MAQARVSESAKKIIHIISARKATRRERARYQEYAWKTPPWLVVVVCALGGAAIARL